MMRNGTNPPSVNREHQICFFESHFTEMKYGWISGESGTSDPKLQWMVSQQSKWSVPTWDAGVWHNMAYEIVSKLPVKWYYKYNIWALANEDKKLGLLCQHRWLLALDRLCCVDPGGRTGLRLDIFERSGLALGHFGTPEERIL